jgi:hypothetical protein
VLLGGIHGEENKNNFEKSSMMSKFVTMVIPTPYLDSCDSLRQFFPALVPITVGAGLNF